MHILRLLKHFEHVSPILNILWNFQTIQNICPQFENHFKSFQHIQHLCLPSEPHFKTFNTIQHIYYPFKTHFETFAPFKTVCIWKNSKRFTRFNDRHFKTFNLFKTGKTSKQSLDTFKSPLKVFKYSNTYRFDNI